MSQDKRAHVRTELPAKVKLIHSSIGEIVLKTGDVSDGGLYVFTDEDILAVGSIVSVQVVNDEVETPVVEMKVVRRDDQGMGMAFV